MSSNHQPDNGMVIDEEMAQVLDQICELAGLESHEDAINFLIKRNLNGSLKNMIAGLPKRPELTVIQGGKQ